MPFRGSTTMMLPIVWFLLVVGWALVLITRTGDQVTPKSVVRENKVRSLKSAEWMSDSMLALGPMSTSHTA